MRGAILLGFPIFVMVLFILIGTAGGFAASGQTINFGGNTQGGSTGLTTFDCSNFNVIVPIFVGSPCLTILPTNGIISCNAGGGLISSLLVCWILGYCPSNLPNPLICSFGNTIIPNGQIIVLTNGQAASCGSANLAGNVNTQCNLLSLKYGAVNLTGFVVLIITAVSIVAVAGLNIFGSGESSEAIHILFLMGLVMGVWFILTGAEGFLTGSTTSGFFYMNKIWNPVGSIFYIMLTLMVSMGGISLVARGGS